MYWSKSVAVVALYAMSSVVNAVPSSFGMGRRDIPQLTQLGISSGCQSTITGLISSPAATCLNLPGTVAIFSTVSNSSWIPPINSWLSTVCSADPCTSDEITSTVGTLADGCTAELATAGITKDFLIQEAVDNFSLAKEAACLRDSSHGNNLCVVTTLQSLETAIGVPLTPDSITANYALLLANNYALAKQIACTPCISAAYNIISPALPQDIATTVNDFVNNQCGSDFSTTPTGSISVATGSDAVRAAQATATNASTRLEAQGLLVGVVAAVSVVASFF